MTKDNKNWNAIDKYLRGLGLMKTYGKFIRLLEQRFKPEYHEVRLVHEDDRGFQHIVITMHLAYGTHSVMAYNIKTEALKLMRTLGLTVRYFAIEVKTCDGEDDQKGN